MGARKYAQAAERIGELLQLPSGAVLLAKQGTRDPDGAIAIGPALTVTLGSRPAIVTPAPSGEREGTGGPSLQPEAPP